MERCNDCFLSKLKDTKDRPYNCAKCELNYHWSIFKRELSETWIGKLPYKSLDLIDKLLKKIYNFMHNQ